MKKIIALFITLIFVISCGDGTEKSSLEELNIQKTAIIAKMDSLNTELQKVEKQISKIDTNKKLHIVTVLPVKNEIFKHFIENFIFHR